MKVAVRLFAALRERAGAREAALELDDGASVDDVWPALGLGEEPAGLVYAVNRAYVERGTPLVDGDEVALIPPVSGGAFLLSDEPLSLERVAAEVASDGAGAIATFVGTTRVDESGDASVEYLEYEAYQPMADRKLEEIGAEIEERWDVGHVSIVHRLGRVNPGEASVAIVVASPRRGPAFEASRYAIERIKEVVPIWKREVWSDGYIWVGSQVGTREPAAGKR